uniref:Putative hu li tai shao n=1 Tax=Ixodes ricinus TaxID=34613 RepID=A0A0K8RHT3_IXORI
MPACARTSLCQEATRTRRRQSPRRRPSAGRPCDLLFEAHMRTLDNSGHRTGYVYRQPLLRNELPRLKTNVEVPPAASSIAQFLEEDKWLSPLKKTRLGIGTTKNYKDKGRRWVNSPNTYQRVEVLETGIQDPKKITKW